MNNSYDHGYSQPGDPRQLGHQFPGRPTYPAPTPGNGTGSASAITAGILAVIVGVGAVLGGILLTLIALGLDNPDDPDDLTGASLALLLAIPAVGVLWLIGATLLFLGKAAGRILLIVLSALGTIGCVIAICVDPKTESPCSGSRSPSISQSSPWRRDPRPDSGSPSADRHGEHPGSDHSVGNGQPPKPVSSISISNGTSVRSTLRWTSIGEYWPVESSSRKVKTAGSKSSDSIRQK